ncbi:MAG: Holliday junction branch migration DNA helicase RuvB, partial [Anaerolineaceae bacterium]|nr:Holliday junction branch migration DNA helicase RuvB [Anaerolineaceae bacterium]
MSNETNRMVDPEAKPDDRLDQALRPKSLADIIGQEGVKENLS